MNTSLIPTNSTHIDTDMMATLEKLSYHRMTWRELFSAIDCEAVAIAAGNSVPVRILLEGADGNIPYALVAPDNDTCVQLRAVPTRNNYYIITPAMLADAYVTLTGAYDECIDDCPATFGCCVDDPEEITFIEAVGMFPQEVNQPLCIILKPYCEYKGSILVEDLFDGHDDEEDDDDEEE